MGNMNKTAIFFVLLVTISSISSTENFDILDELVELNKKAGNAEGITSLLSQVKDAYEKTTKAFMHRYNGLKQSFKAGNDELAKSVKEVKGHISDAKDEINKAKKEVKDSGKDVLKYEKNLAGEKKGLININKRISKLLEDNKKHFIEANEKLAVIKTLKDIVVDELLNVQSGKGSFIQLGDNFHSKVGQLKTMLAQTKSAEITPLIETLLELAQSKNFADQAIIKKILNVINKLEKSIKSFVKSQKKDSHENYGDLQKQAESKGKSIASLMNLIAEAKSNLAQNTNMKSGYEDDIKHFNRELKRIAANQKDLKKLIRYEKFIANSFENHSKSLEGSIKSAAGKMAQLA